MEIDPGVIIYRPTEKLTSTAVFNYEVAQTFMERADMRIVKLKGLFLKNFIL